ncbi:helix-turn-helix domain-containing protein [Paractinoplanes hotanensis]|uniref:Helix-turn-helix domain-containing protein n=1 Tax=Paractinoplanes hotanensis TaxID=2906497 RepID=A0ABT0Y4V3_9ACTN|nr:helix-turn-helix transcriptional regulator [Actinoplanes hotanensis]MCM4081069.1 helix-turn-helix domain-containing protein [Actinoplanes hotanensis]
MSGPFLAWTLGESRQRLADELRQARSISGLSGRQLAQRIDISQSKVSRVESGVTVPSLPEVRAWAEAVEASDDLREYLLALTQATHTNVLRWRADLAGRPHIQDQIEQTEREARRILIFQPSVVPGLMQTAEYARLVFRMFEERPYEPDELYAAIKARLDRQLLLFDETRSFEFMITEGALRWRPGSMSLLAAQLDRIGSLSTLSNVEVGLLPLADQAVVPHSHAFTIYEPGSPEREEFVNVEMVHGNLQVLVGADVAAYRRRWESLGRNAVRDDEARGFLHRLADEMRQSA